MEWFQKYMNITLNILALGISNHVLLCLDSQNQDKHKKRTNFKFLNSVTSMEGYKQR